MILTKQDLDSFVDAYSDFQTDYSYCELKQPAHDVAYFQFMNWLNDNPQVLMATGYQEFLASGNSQLFPRSHFFDPSPQPFFKAVQGTWIHPAHIPTNANETWEAYTLSHLHKIEASYNRHDLDDLIESYQFVMPSAATILQKAAALVDNPILDPTMFVSPKLWTPGTQQIEKEYLAQRAIPVIQAIQEERCQLHDIKWQELEEIVAEILRASGMDIHLVKENPQGGRDIIARGSLIPGGSPVSIAVEVKHRPNVDRPEVQKALYQNRMYPALMFITSGTFSAGVIREANLPENRMRLFLNDGVAVKELINLYKL